MAFSRKKRFTLFFILSLVLTLVLSACGSTSSNNASSSTSSTSSDSNTGTSSQSSTTTATAAPTKISIMTNLETPEPVRDDNPILLAIEKKTNTKLNITWVPVNSYNDKVNVTLASGALPDLMLIPSTTLPQFTQMVQQGAFWDLTPYIKDYPNLARFPKDTWDNSKVFGKEYGIPRPRPLDGAGDMPMVRKDWLDKLNLKVPQTMDDMFNVLKAFTENDPDGNGKADTTGLTGYVNDQSMGNLHWVEEVFNDVPGDWKVVNGNLTPTVLLPGTEQALQWLHNAYAKKYMVQDFAILKYTQSRDKLMSSQAGVLGSAMNPQWLFTNAIRKQVPNADMYPLPYLIGPDGKKYAPKDTGYAGIYVIPKSVPESKMKAILSLMDYGASDEGADLAEYGVKDKDYTMQGDFKVATKQAAQDQVGQNYLGQIFGKFEKYQRAYLTGITKDLYDQNTQVIDERAKISVPDPSVGLISEAMQKYGPDFEKKIQDMKTKVIMGKVPLSSWEDFVNQLKKDSNYQKIMTEMNAAYQKKIANQG